MTEPGRRRRVILAYSGTLCALCLVAGCGTLGRPTFCGTACYGSDGVTPHCSAECGAPGLPLASLLGPLGRCCGRGPIASARGDRGGDHVPIAKFHPLPTRPVFAPRADELLPVGTSTIEMDPPSDRPTNGGAIPTARPPESNAPKSSHPARRAFSAAGTRAASLQPFGFDPARRLSAQIQTASAEGSVADQALPAPARFARPIPTPAAARPRSLSQPTSDRL